MLESHKTVLNTFWMKYFWWNTELFKCSTLPCHLTYLSVTFSYFLNWNYIRRLRDLRMERRLKTKFDAVTSHHLKKSEGLYVLQQTKKIAGINFWMWRSLFWRRNSFKIHFEFVLILLYFDLRPGPKILFQGNTSEGSDTFQRPVIERDRVGGLRLMIWDKVKVPLCHYSHAPEESNLWTAWQLFPLDDD